MVGRAVDIDSVFGITIPVVGVYIAKRSIDGDFVNICCSQAMIICIAVGERAPLQDRIIGEFYPGNQGRGVERRLFFLGEKIVHQPV